MSKVVKVSIAATQSMCEHVASLFYDRDRKSSFFFNMEYQNHYGDLIELFVKSIPHVNDKPLSKKNYEWFLRQCKIPDIQNLHQIDVHEIFYGGLRWYAFYSAVRSENQQYYVIWHFSYKLKKNN